MKAFTIIILTVLTFNNSLSQWIQQPLGTTSEIEEVEFLNKNTGWCCGAGGLLRKTTDGGLNWIPINHPVGGKFLADLSIIDSNTIYVVGFFETIIKTTNGGSNWTVIRNGPTPGGTSFESCFFINGNTGWMAGSNQPPVKVLYTTNGGISFDSTIINQASGITDIYFKNSNEGLVSGRIKDLYKTTNGGMNWFNCQINLPTNYPGFFEMSFVNNFTGFVPAGDGRVFKTTNFGTSWDTVTKITGLGNSGMQCIEFVNENTGWIGGQDGFLFKTTNGGFNWMREVIGFGTFIKINFITDSVGWICGTPGKMFHTTTAGQGVVFVSNETQTINGFELSQNYPNPFNPNTIINYQLTINNFVILNVYDVNGRLVKELINEKQSAGNYEINFDGSGLPSGTYVYRLQAGDFSESKKMVLLK